MLVIGASTGYGLASRITAAFGAGAATLGIFFERKGRDQAGHCRLVQQRGVSHVRGGGRPLRQSINGDAFSDEIKQRPSPPSGKTWARVDLVVYSLAAPVASTR